MLLTRNGNSLEWFDRIGLVSDLQQRRLSRTQLWLLATDYEIGLPRTLEAYRTQLPQRSTGVTSSRLRLYYDIRRFLDISYYVLRRIPNRPPSSNTLDKATADIDAAIVRARRQIELLQEYRTRLIADVVTGKLDVREVAAQLPDEDEDQGPIEERGPLADSHGRSPL